MLVGVLRLVFGDWCLTFVVVHGLVFGVCRSVLFIACTLLFGFWLLDVVRCVLFVVGCLVCCCRLLLIVDCCSMSVVCCLVFVSCCTLFGNCCFWVVV